MCEYNGKGINYEGGMLPVKPNEKLRQQNKLNVLSKIHKKWHPEGDGIESNEELEYYKQLEADRQYHVQEINRIDKELND